MSFPLFNNINNNKSNSQILSENSSLKFFNEFLSIDNNILSKKNKELKLQNLNLINKINQLENINIEKNIYINYYKLLTLTKIKQQDTFIDFDDYNMIN